MTIQKLKKHQDQIPYSMVARDVIQSITNPDSLAIWIYLQSLPDDWQVKEDQIRSHFDIGRTRYMAAMRQLRELGLYEIVRTKDQNNNFTGCFFQIYPFPQVSKTIPTQNRTYIKEKDKFKEKDRFKEKDNTLTESNCDDRTGQNDLIESSKITPSSYRTETTTDINSQTNALFDLFYQAYPKKKAKQDALKAWRKLNPDQELIKEILSKLVIQKQTIDWTKDNGKFIPNPATYLNGRRWEDEITVEKKSFNDMTTSDLADYWG